MRRAASLFGIMAALGCDGAGLVPELAGAASERAAQRSALRDTATPTAQGDPAYGIAIDSVIANQGLPVRVWDQGAPVDPAQRLVPLLSDRGGAFEVHWSTDADWIPREIEARLVLDDASAQSWVFSRTSWIDAASGMTSWPVDSSLFAPGTELRVELLEGAADPDAPMPEDPPATPMVPLEVEPNPALLRVVVVPLNYDSNGCTTTIDPDDLTGHRETLEMMLPVSQLEIEVHPAMDWVGGLSDLNQVTSWLSGVRADEEPDPDVIYHALINPCVGSIGGAGGVAMSVLSTPPTVNEASLRVSMSLFRPSEFRYWADLFVHELGHVLGRDHVQCRGDEGSPDPSYPDPGGELSELGYGIIDRGVRAGGVFRDLMSYCTPQWASAWTWNRVHPVLTTFAEWPGVGQRSSEHRMLLGVRQRDGSTQWTQVPGHPPDPTGLAVVGTVEFYADDRALGSQVVQALPGTDGQPGILLAAVPEHDLPITRVTHVQGAASTTLAVSRLDK